MDLNILADMYVNGMSIPEISKEIGMPQSNVRYRLKKVCSLRSRGDGVRNAATKGLLSHLKGKKRIFTDEWKNNIRDGRNKWAEKNAIGITLKKSGYLELTRGKDKGKSLHITIMENRLARSLLPDECVHHIDGNKQNNNENNLALMTRSGHSRHHRIFETNKRRRDSNGMFC